MEFSKKEIKIINFIFISIFFIRILFLFPTVYYNGTPIRLFALAPFSDVLLGNEIFGNVLGNYILNTEYGEVHLNNFCEIDAYRYEVSKIARKNFIRNKAYHNLIVNDFIIPKNIHIIFDYNNFDNRLLTGQDTLIRYLELNGQVIFIAGIPFKIFSITFDKMRTGADIEIKIANSPNYLYLNESIQIQMNMKNKRFLGVLHIFIDEKKWILENKNFPIKMRLRGENIIYECRSITFEENWGTIIEKELFIE